MEDDKSSHCLLLPKYKPRKVSAVRDFPNGLKQFPDYVVLKSTSGQACGLQDKHLKETGPHDTLSCHDTQLQKGDSIVDLEEEKQCGVGVEEVIHNNPEGLKHFSEDVDLESKVDESYGSKNAKEFNTSAEESDPKEKGGKACGSTNESLKPIETHEASIDYERDVAFEKGVVQLGTKQQCVNGDNNRVYGLEKNSFCQKVGAFSNSVNLVADGVRSWREEQQLESEQEADHFSCLQKQHAYDNGYVLGCKESMKCQDIGTSSSSCNLLGILRRKFPNRRKVSAIRDFPPALVRLIPLNPRQRNTKMSDGYKKSENVGECFETDVQNKKDLDFLKTDDSSHSKANEWKESSFNSGKELLLDKVVSADHLGMVEHSYSHIVRSSDGANMLEPKYGINNVETGVGSRFLINDESRLDMENREFHNPSAHASPAVNDVQESTYPVDAPDDMLSLAPPNVAVFFSEDCHNGFLFEDYDEPYESNSQSVWQDGSEEISKTSHDIGTMDHGITAIAGLGDDEQNTSLNDIRNEASKANKLSISGKGEEDVSSLFIPQKNPSCKNTQGFSQQRFSRAGGSISKDKGRKYRMGEVGAKKVQREVIKLEGGGSRVGKVKYMPNKEARKALEKSNNSLSVKIYKKAPVDRVSENIAGRVIVQGLMAAKRCPWRHSRK